MATTKRARTPKPVTGITAPVLTDDTESMSSGRGAPAEGRRPDTSPAPARDMQRVGSGGTLADQIGDAVTGTIRVTQAVLPNRLPVYLGVAALVVVGVLDPPVGLAGGLTYETLRRWSPNIRRGAR